MYLPDTGVPLSIIHPTVYDFILKILVCELQEMRPLVHIGDRYEGDIII
jgi:hypothetical protein